VSLRLHIIKTVHSLILYPLPESHRLNCEGHIKQSLQNRLAGSFRSSVVIFDYCCAFRAAAVAFAASERVHFATVIRSLSL